MYDQSIPTYKLELVHRGKKIWQIDGPAKRELAPEGSTAILSGDTVTLAPNRVITFTWKPVCISFPGKKRGVKPLELGAFADLMSMGLLLLFSSLA